MKSKVIQVVSLIVVFSGIGAGIYIWDYCNQEISIERKKYVVCIDPQHQGDRYLKKNIEVIQVPRKDAKKYKDIEEGVVCQVCQARREREEREAKERAEAEELMRNLEASFGFGKNRKEISVKPGQEIYFNFSFRNRGTQPIEEDIKVLIQPGDLLRLMTPLEYYGPFWNGYFGKDHVQRETPRFKKLTTTGLKIADRILPYDSPYYPKFGGVFWNSSELWLTLKKTVKSGQDIHFTGYIIIKNHKIPVGTVTVHVMYPE